MKRKDLIKDVKIVDPPIYELNKKSSGLKRSCFFGCSFIFLIIFGLLIGLKFYLGSGPKTVTVIPLNFPLEDIPVHNKEKIVRMTFISGEYKNRRMEIAAIFPKLVLLPLWLNSEHNQEQTEEKISFKNLFQTLTTPVSDKNDNFKIEWEDIENNLNSFLNYYQKELERKNFIINSYAEGNDYKKIEFVRNDGYTGTIYAENKSNQKNKVTYAFLVLNMPPLENK